RRPCCARPGPPPNGSPTSSWPGSRARTPPPPRRCSRPGDGRSPTAPHAPPPAELRLEVLTETLTAATRTADQEALAMVEPELWAAIERDPAGTRSIAIELFKAMELTARFEEAARLLPAAVQAAADEGDMENAFRMDSQLRT